MSAPTPGPLTVHETLSRKLDEVGDHAIVDSAGRVIGEAFALVGAGEHRPARANAVLWAASAELLAAAKAMLEPGAHGWEQLRAAIAKAESR